MVTILTCPTCIYSPGSGWPQSNFANVFRIRILYKKASIRWQDSARPISGYWPTSEPNTGYSDAMMSRLPRNEAKCVQRNCLNGGRSLCVQISRERSYPLPIGLYWYHSKGNWLRYNFAADSLYNETLQQTSRPLLSKLVWKAPNLGIWSPFWKS